MKLRHIARQKGLSLVETMIALTLGAIVTVGVVQLFVANSETYNLLQGQSRMQESARFALDFISRNVQLAGYKGCYSRNDDPHTTLETDNHVPYEYNIRQGLEAYDGQAGGGWLPDVTAIPGTPIDTTDIVPKTDILTIRRSASNEVKLVEGTMSTSTEPAVLNGKFDDEFAVDDLALIHDCEKSTVFRITAVSYNNGSNQTTIGHDTNDTDPIRNALEKLAEVNTYDKNAYVSNIETNIFFIQPGTGKNNQGDAPLSLWMQQGTAAPVELVEGVENLDVFFGEDTDNDGTPNVYARANEVDMANVVTVEINIVVNSVDDVGATSSPTHGCIADGGQQPCLNGVSYDGLIRRSFTQTVELRNQG
ncbi:MAG: PilW family protein [Pseudomonadales bacterium]|nr:PilW family protein [Pseudomonadales bacterium]